MKKREHTFGIKLYSMFLISILIPTCIAILCFWVYSIQLTIEREEKNIQSILNSVLQNLELQFSENGNVWDTFYINKKVFQEAEYLNNSSLYQYYDELTKSDMEDNYTVTLTKVLHTASPDVRAVVFFPVSGEDKAYYLGKDSSEIREISYPEYKKENWYRAVTEDNDVASFFVTGVPEYMPNKKLGEIYSYVAALRNMDNHKIIGVVKVDISKEKLQNTLDTLQETDEDGLILVQKGEVFAQSSNLDKVDDLGEDYATMAGKRYHLVSKKITGTDLEIAYLYSRVSIYQEFASVIILSLLIVAAGVILAFVYYRHQAKKMVHDVNKITEVLHCVETGNLENHIEVLGKSEFRKIALVINRMIDNLKEYIEKEYILVIQQKEAEYRALQSQINPHFLYNTLNGFVALNRMGEKKTLERSIIGLSRLFRYACSKQNISCVYEEVDFLEEYLKLEKLKYDQRLEYIIWVDEECKQMKIPKLLLQPIVENSIKHGMGDTEQPIMIRISAIYSEMKGFGNAMILTVRDNGVGFDTKERENRKENVGVENVRLRAELYCKNVIYQCVSKPGQGTKTTFLFPDER